MRLRRNAAPPLSVRHLMKPCVAADPDERLAAAAGRMRAERTGALAVMEAGRLVGILTERDLLGAMADGLDPGSTSVSACMTAAPVHIGAGEPADEAAERMVELGVRHLPVLEAGRVAGMISARDLLRRRRHPSLETLCSEPW